MKLSTENFGTLDGRKVTKYTLTNKHDVSISVLDYGGIWQAFTVPSTHGPLNLLYATNDVHTYDKTASLCASRIIGRTAGRLANGQFTIDGRQYQVDTNENGNTIHGGPNGIGGVIWHVEPLVGEHRSQLVLTYTANHDLDSYPGDLAMTTIYTLDDNDAVTLDFTAQSSAPTLFNPTCHTYWNLSDHDNTIENHLLQINGDHHLECDDAKLPTGRLLPVDSTSFDFTRLSCLGNHLHTMEKTTEGGFDDIWKVTPSRARMDSPIATLEDGTSHRRVDIYSDRNGLVMYTANNLHIQGYNRPANQWMAIALEPQTLPDTPNHPEFGDIVVRPNQPRHYQIRYEYHA